MKSGRSNVIGVINVDPAAWSRGGHEALMMVEAKWRGDSARPAANRPPVPATAALEANLSSLFVELNDELKALNRRLKCAIASAGA